MIARTTYLLMVLLLLGACQSMDIEDFKETEPKFVLEQYFEGQTKAKLGNVPMRSFVQKATNERLAEWLDEDEYRLRASDHSGAGYLELTTEIAAQAFGSGIGIGVMEGSSSALEGTAYTLEVMAM